MTAARITYTAVDGSLRLVIPAPEYVATFETEAAAIEAIKRRPGSVPPGALNVTVRDLADLPPSGLRFINCWRHGTRIEVDLPRARHQRLAEIRRERDQRFPPLDAEWMKAVAAGDTVRAATVELKRQVLRDVPQTTNLGGLATPEALAAFEPVWPTEPA